MMYKILKVLFEKELNEKQKLIILFFILHVRFNYAI